MKKLLLSAIAICGALSMNAQDVYFFDDFEWLEPWSSQKPAGQTIEENNADATAQQLGTNTVDEVSTYDALLAKGYEFLATHHADKSAREAKAQIYLQRNYLKFGLTAYYSGIVLPSIANVPADANVVLSFDWSTQRAGNSETAKFDKVKLVVIIKNGEEEKQFAVPELNIADGAAYAWYPASIELTDAKIDKDTKIIIRNCDEQWPSANVKDKFRYFLDNIKVAGKEAGVNDIIADGEEAPAVYYNLQGVRVDNPAAGSVVIVRKGNKAYKQLVK